MLRKIFPLFCIFILSTALLLTGCGKQADNIVRVAVDVQNEPYAFQRVVEVDYTLGDSMASSLRTDIDYTGFEVELMDAVAKKAGLTIQFVPMPWVNILNSVEKGECAVGIGDLSVTDERSKMVSFSQPYISDAGTVAVVRQNSNINTFAELDGKRIGVELGTTFPGKLMQLKSATITGYLGMSELNRDFLSGGNTIDAMLMDAYQFRYFQKNGRYVNDKAIVLADNESIAMAVNKNKEDLLKTINKAIADLEASGELSALKQKWFGTAQK